MAQLGGLHRWQQVRILRSGEKSIVDMPFDHPQGMSVSGLLKSEAHRCGHSQMDAMDDSRMGGLAKQVQGIPVRD